MNNNYTQNPMFPESNSQIGSSLEPYNTPNQQTAPNINYNDAYNENILRANIGKIATFYMTFTDSVEWRDKSFTGIIEEAGRDHVIISDPKTGKWTLLVLLYLDYIEFNEPINYPSMQQARIR
ncbi:MAG: spore coat protein GerQ [Firmicutes bacterium]|nr:spore coat protein GerQ [Bacillota bacterium]